VTGVTENNRSGRKNLCRNATLFTINPACIGLEQNQILSGEMPVTDTSLQNCLTTVNMPDRTVSADRARGWTLLCPAGAADCAFQRNAHSMPGAHQASYSMGARSSFLGAKRSGREVDHPSSSSTEVMNRWSYASTPACIPSSLAQGQLYVPKRVRKIAQSDY
jgi:hypothetical protein